MADRSAAYYEKKAEESRVNAENMSSQMAKDAMYSIAASYDQLAAEARQREARKPKRSN